MWMDTMGTRQRRSCSREWGEQFTDPRPVAEGQPFSPTFFEERYATIGSIPDDEKGGLIRMWMDMMGTRRRRDGRPRGVG